MNPSRLVLCYFARCTDRLVDRCAVAGDQAMSRKARFPDSWAKHLWLSRVRSSDMTHEINILIVK